MTLWKSVYHRENQKVFRKLQHKLKADLIPLANTPISDLAQDHLKEALMSQLPL